MEGLVVEVDGKVKTIGGSVIVNRDEASTRITFPVLEKGKKWVVLFRF